VLASKIFTRTHRTYKYGHIHAAQKEQQNSTLLITTYTDVGYENLTLGLVSDFQHALFTILDKKIRIKAVGET
jgi:hypothetical protein